MEFKLGNSVVNSYKRLSYTPWYAFAEFVDNSTQAYFNNKSLLDSIFEKESSNLTISIFYYSDEDKIVIKDNSIGMNSNEIQNALIVGLPPQIDNGRSKYGLGMKTSACWFGDEWKIITTKFGDNKRHEVVINVNQIISNTSEHSTKVEHTETPANSDEHYTIIEISQLNRSLKGKTLGKIRDHLKSIYRYDFKSYGLKLFWQGDLLEWEDLIDKLHKNIDEKPYKIDFNFKLSNGKNVSGWVGVLRKGYGGRKNAGFSIIKSNRVIQGWPNGFKPSTIFGDLDYGVNDLVNQRITGEIFLDDFEVSHTKDTIVWLDNELQELEEKLEQECKEAVYVARTLRYFTVKEDSFSEIRNEAISVVETELKSSEIVDYLTSVQPPEEDVIKQSLNSWTRRTMIDSSPEFKIEIGVDGSRISVLVYFVDYSEFDPYVVVETSIHLNTVNVIINTLHPHVSSMTTSESLINFIRHCIYDGVAEWKAIKLLGSIQPYTIKNLKDGLLRLPFVIKQNKFTSNT